MLSQTIHYLVASAKADIVEIDIGKVRELSLDSARLIIDVREPDEFSQGHIEGAINIPRGVLEFRTDPSYAGGIPGLYEKSAKLILYCRSGARSALAAQSLGRLGYKSVVSMAGGFMAWKEASLPIV